MSSRKKFLNRAFPLIFVLVGAILMAFGIRDLIRAKASAEWPTAEGKIISSSVESHRSSRGIDRRASTTYHAEILYEFVVDYETFNGDQVAYGDYGSSDSSHARSIVNRYPAGKRVTVYYIHGNPEECLLEPGLKGQSWFFLAFGLCFFVFGSLFSVLMNKKIKKEETTEQSISFDSK